MIADGTQHATGVVLAGHGREAERWARTLRGVDGVTVIRPASSDDDFLAGMTPDIGAVVFAGGVTDLASGIKRALMAERHVFVAGCPALTSKQLHSIAELAKRRNRVVLFDTGIVGDERADFVRRMTGGLRALWRPRYVRALRTGAQGRRLDDLAMAEIAATLAFAGGEPTSVSAVAPAADDESTADATMLTIAFAHGAVARIDISLLEAESRHEITVACEGRTIVLDSYNARAPLQILAGARHNGPAHDSWAETVSERPAGDRSERRARLAALFIAAVRGRDAAASNVAEIAAAAVVWEAARASMLRGGEMLPLQDEPRAVERPVLQLIRGGGRGGAARNPAALTLLSREAVVEPLSSA